jgi:ribose transport system ATP-binding protein
MGGALPALDPSPVEPQLAFERIWKSFSGIPVLKGVEFAVRRGRVLGLVGENGAGKSTLMNILGGNLRPDSGRMVLDGAEYRPRTPAEAGRRGIAFIHQELNLFVNLSIAENLFLDGFPSRRVLAVPIIRRRALRERAAGALARVGLEADPDLPVERLSAGGRQLVEIARALLAEARLLILDEPTTSLSARETEVLFRLLASFRSEGLTMIYISHALNDVLRLADDVAVLRDGEVAAAGRREDFDTARLVTLMVGRPIERLYPERRSPPSGEPVLEVRGLTRTGVIEGVDFTLHRGEVLGVAGLLGAGRTELARMVFGAEPFDAGQVLIDGRPARPSPRKSIRLGLAFSTEDRRADGLSVEAEVGEEIGLVALGRFVRGPGGWIDRPALDRAVADAASRVRLDLGGRAGRPVRTLSGGNQQKVALAKWLLAGPRVLILDEPTRGIDVGARAEIYALIAELADRGVAVLLISSEIEELIGLSDRVLVLASGRIVDRLDRSAFGRERILRAALGEGGRP